MCRATGCWNTAGALYCAVLDIVTREAMAALKARQATKANRALWTRLAYLFDAGMLPRDRKLLADCVPADRDNVWFNEVDAEELGDFATELLRRVYSEPERIRQVLERRAARA